MYNQEKYIQNKRGGVRLMVQFDGEDVCNGGVEH